jgi:hypothetical protein
MFVLLKRTSLAVSLASALLLFIAGLWPVEADEGDCVYNPAQSCCQCNGDPQTPTNCKEEPGHGGVYYCSDQVCPIDDEPCWGSPN